MRATAAPAPVAAAPVADGPYRWIATAIVGLGAVASFLSTTVVNVALPTLQRDLHASLTAVQWTSSAYLLGLATVVPISGWTSDRFGARRTYLTSLALFTVASLLCGFAHDIVSLIAFRALQGMAGGMVMPVGMALLMRIFPPHKRGLMMSALGVPNMLAPAFGPTLSGLVLVHTGWQYIFWINVPFCTVTLACAAVWLREPDRHPPGKLDVVGAALGVPGITLLIYGMTRASDAGWASAAALAPMLAGSLLVAAFAVWELRQREPLIDLRLFRDAAFSASSVTSLIITAGVFGLMLVVPVFMQQVQGYSAFDAGTTLSIQALVTAAMLPISGWATDRFGARPVVLFGTSVLACISFVMATATPETSRATWAAMLAVRGVGGAFSMMPVASAAFVTIPPRLLSRASALSNVVQRIGMALGTAVIATIAQARVAAALPAGVHASPVLVQHAIARGLDHAMLCSAGASLLTLPTVLLLRRPLPPGREAEGHPRVPRPLRRLAVALAALSATGCLLALGTALATPA